CKFVGFSTSAHALLEAAGVAELIDAGYVPLDAKKTTAVNFIKTCRKLRYWDRERPVESA
ncbi:MAG: hypothetical protein ACXVLM_22000, partial [Ilumatobacteraceae bacterium]